MNLEYLLYHVATLALWVLLTQSLAFLWRANLFSLGHYGFVCIGAYIALIVVKLSTPLWFGGHAGTTSSPLVGFVILIGSLVIGAVGAGLIGRILFHLLRYLRDDYFAVSTLLFAEIVQSLVSNFDFVGGTMGAEVPYLFVKDTGHGHLTYVGFFALVGVALNVLLFWWLCRIQKSIYGLSIVAFKDDELAGLMRGIDVKRYQGVIFALGTATAGLAGAIQLHFTTLITPSDFNFAVMVPVILYVVLGNLKSFPCIVAAIGLYTVYEMAKLRFLGILGPSVGNFFADHKDIFFSTILLLSVLLPAFFASKKQGATRQRRSTPACRNN